MKKLPLNTTNALQINPNLGIILSADMTGWFYERYVNIFMNGTTIDYVDNVNYSGLIAVQRHYRYDEIVANGIISIIEKELDNGSYMHVWVDEFALPQSIRYNKNHFVHPLMVYGYDDTQRVVFGVFFDINKGQVLAEINYQDFFNETATLNKTYQYGGTEDAIKKTVLVCALPEQIKGVFHIDVFGYRKDADGNPCIILEEAEVVRTLFQMVLDGASLGMLKEYLEGKHIKTPKGKDEWSLTVIRYMLSNEKYVGDILYQKSYRTDCISKKAKINRGEVTRYLISNNHPAIIDRDTFNLVQAELARRTNTRKKFDSAITKQGKYSGKYALSELLVCGSCGSSYKRTSKVAKGKTTYYWRCISRIEHGKTFCKDSAGIEEQMLHSAICRCLSKMMENSGEVFSLIQNNLSYAVSGNSVALDVFSIEKQMNDLKMDIQQMTKLASRTEGNSERYEVELKKMFDQLVALRGQLDLAKSQASQSDTVNAEVARIMEILKHTDMSFTEFDDVTVRRLIDCIQVCGNQKIIVTLKGGYQAEEELRRTEVA